MSVRYRILGADKASHEPVEITIIASDEATARADAAARGLIPLGVEVLGETASAQRAAPVSVRIDHWPVLLIERTAKRWKSLVAISAILICAGLLLIAWAAMRDPRNLTDPALSVIIGAAAAGLGLFMLVFARLGAWWYHG